MGKAEEGLWGPYKLDGIFAIVKKLVRHASDHKMLATGFSKRSLRKT